MDCQLIQNAFLHQPHKLDVQLDEPSLAGLAEMLALVLEEWQLLGRGLPSETEFLLRQYETAKDHDQVLASVCAWAEAARLQSDPDFLTRPLSRLLQNCGQPSSVPVEIRLEMDDLLRLPLAEVIADQQELRFYNQAAKLGQSISTLRKRDPRPFFKSLQIAESHDLAAALTVLTLQSPSFAVAAGRLESLLPGLGCASFAELLRRIYLAMLPEIALPQQSLEPLLQALQALASGYGEEVWSNLGEQALVRNGAYLWYLKLLADPTTPTACNQLNYNGTFLANPSIDCKRINEPLVKSFIFMLNGHGGKALEVVDQQLNQVIEQQSLQRLVEAARSNQRQLKLNHLWCDMVPVE